jgi:hypothetical protein
LLVTLGVVVARGLVEVLLRGRLRRVRARRIDLVLEFGVRPR